MKVAVFTGTPVKGITYRMKEDFLSNFSKEDEITQFYPKDMPEFCLGCKNCFFHGEDKCPHFDKMGPIRKAIMEADLLVFAYPVYALRAPASLKSMLDHLCVNWMVHRPEKVMFSKRAVILTNSVGAPNGAAQKDIKTSMKWMGVSKIYTYGQGMMGDILIDKLSEKHAMVLREKTKKLYKRVMKGHPVRHMSLKVWIYFKMCVMMHKGVMKGEEVVSLDNQHYVDNGWIKPKEET